MVRLPSATLPVLAALALLYLLAPCLLFLSGWVEPVAAVPTGLLLTGGVFLVWRHIPRKAISVSKRDILLLLLALLGALVVLELLGGFTGHAPQPGDFPVRNATYETLIRNKWPLVSARGENFVYYHAFWLPPALVSKWTGGTGAYPLLFWWCFAGVALGFCLFFMKLKGRVALYFLLLCLLGSLTEWVGTGGHGFMESHGVEAGVKLMDAVLPVHNMSYVAWGTQITWTFNHGIPLFLLLSLLLPGHLPLRHRLLPAALILPASPLGGVCLLPLLVLQSAPLWRHPGKLVAADTLAVLPFVGVMALYYAGGTPLRCSLIFPNLANGELLQTFLLCIGWTVLPAWFVLRPYRRTNLFRFFLLLALLLPCIIIGAAVDGEPMGVRNNELLYKGSLPLFMVLAWLYMHRLRYAGRTLRGVIIAYMFASCGMLFWRGFRGLNHYTWNPAAMQENIRSEWGGHLNHPERDDYANFWSSTPPHWPIRRGN